MGGLVQRRAWYVCGSGHRFRSVAGRIRRERVCPTCGTWVPDLCEVPANPRGNPNGWKRVPKKRNQLVRPHNSAVTSAGRTDNYQIADRVSGSKSDPRVDALIDRFTNEAKDDWLTRQQAKLDRLLPLPDSGATKLSPRESAEVGDPKC